MKKIIVPIDFSKASMNALKYAIQMFGVNADIHIVHVMPGELGGDEVLDQDVTENRTMTCKYQLIDYIQRELEIAFFPENFKIVMQLGTVVSSIVNYTKKNNFDVMVLATRDKHNLIDRWIGTISFGIVKQLDIPIYLVPIYSKFDGFKKVLAASDYQVEKTNSILSISKWNKKHNAFIKFLHIHTNDSPAYKKEREQILRGIFREEDPGFGFEVATLNSNDITDGLLGEAYNYHADLMIVLPENQTFLQTLLFKSVTKELILKSSIPLLFLPQTYTKETGKEASQKSFI